MQRKLGSIVVCALALGAVSAFGAGKRTPWGDPDLQGTYTTDNSIGVPLERPTQFGTRAELSDEEYAARVSANDVQVAKDQNPLPESEFAEDSAANNAPRHWLERPANPVARDVARRRPARRSNPGADAGWREARGGAARATDSWRLAGILQGLQQLRPLHQPRRRGIGSAGDLRQRHEDRASAGVRGDSKRDDPRDARDSARRAAARRRRRARVDGRLARPLRGRHARVETTNLNQSTGVGGFGNGALQSAQAKLVERLTRLDARTIRYELTVNDPVIYTRPWTVRLNLDSKPGYEIYEYACHEGNYGLANMLSAARAQERAAAAQPPGQQPATQRKPAAPGAGGE